MDGQDYLEQISKSSKPVKVRQSKMGGLMSSKYVKLIGGALIALVLIMIVGVMLGSGKNGGPKEQSYRLLLHLNGTSSLVQEYQPSIKSSKLRSSAASLYSVLTNTALGITSYLEQKYEFRGDQDIEESIVEQATLETEALNQDLFQAKINGFMDRIMAHKMAYEIRSFQAEEKELWESGVDEQLQNALKSSYDSLENLYPYFNDFSETK